MPLIADPKDTFQKLLHFDYFSLGLQILLLICGVLFIRHAGIEYGTNASSRWIQQIIWIFLGGGIYFFLALTDYRLLAKFSLFFYIFALVALLFVAVFGSSVNGSRCLLKLGQGISIQISEITKPCILLSVAWILSHPILEFLRIPREILWIVLTALPCFLILLEPDCGTALVYIPFTFAILFINKMRWKSFLALCLAGILALPFLYLGLKSYQKLRIFVFAKQPAEALLVHTEKSMPKLTAVIRDWLNEETAKLSQKKSSIELPKLPPSPIKEPTFSTKDENSLDDWNAKQALYSVGSGGFTGVGYGKGTQHSLGYLPRYVAPTDFIFAVIAEEIGFFGCLLVLFCELGIILLACRTAWLQKSALGAGIAIGAAVLYTTHLVVNVGMNIGWMPIIGIPLPFVSYGGSFMLSMMAIAGLVQSVHISAHRTE